MKRYDIVFDMVQPPSFNAELSGDALIVYWQRPRRLIAWLFWLLVLALALGGGPALWREGVSPAALSLVGGLVLLSGYMLVYKAVAALRSRATVIVDRFRLTVQSGPRWAQRQQRFDLADIVSFEPADRRVLGLFWFTGVAARLGGNQLSPVFVGFLHSAETLFLLQTLERRFAPPPIAPASDTTEQPTPAEAPPTDEPPPLAPRFSEPVRRGPSVQANGGDEPDEFFPLCGITLGQTTVDELAQIGQGNPLLHARKGDGNYYEINATDYWFNVWYHDYDVAHSMYLVHTFPLPEPWRQLGFDWELSYDQWFQLLLDLGFEIKVTKPPKVVVYNGHDSLRAELQAKRKRPGTTPLHLDLNFAFSRGTETADPDTLYGLTVRVLPD